MEHEEIRKIRLKKAEGYVAGGRRWSGLPDDELRARWVSAFKAWAHDLPNPDKKREHDDFDSELALRGIELPLKDVEEELALIEAEFTRVYGPEADFVPGPRR
jgi:hypothetical protein